MNRRAIGTITPSSNRTVERTVQEVLRHFPQLDACFARVPFYGDGLGQPADAYATESYREAAWLLGHAGVEVVCWNGTKGAGLGLPVDEALCAMMAEAAGVPATTASLATGTLLQRLGAKRIGFVVPGAADYARTSGAGFAPLGLETVAMRGLGLTDNLAAGAVPPERIAALVREVAAEARPDAILIWSTNLPGWMLMAPLEAELGVPVLDSAAVGVWACLAALGLDPAPAAALGRIFSLPG
jgi:maleate isomerase